MDEEKKQTTQKTLEHNKPLTRFQQTEQTQSGFRDTACVPVKTEKYICCSAGQ